MNPQEVFDKVVNHLRTQQQKAETRTSNGGVQCQYRTPFGLTCAAGCMFEDGEYHYKMEGETIDRILEQKAKVIVPSSLINRLYEHRSLLRTLQQVHDHHSMDKWEAKFQAVARSYDLTYAPPID